MNIFRLLIPAFFSMAIGGSQIMADDAKLLFEKTIPTEAGKELVTSLIAGGVTVTSWSQNEVNVKVFGNDEAEEKVIFSAEPTATGVKVEGKQKDSKNFKNLTIRVEIVIPKNYDVKLHSAGGSFSISGVNGKIETNSSGGSIKIENTNGNIEAYTAGGNISIDNSNGDIKASTSGGKISVSQYSGNIDVSTAGGSVSLDGGNGKIDASTAGGNIILNYTGKNLGVDLSTLGGNITVSLPTDFDADADIGTLAGKITCDFAKVEQKNHVASYVRAKFNNGGESFKCTTSAGNIVVSKK